MNLFTMLYETEISCEIFKRRTMTTSGTSPITQPPFDPRISTLAFPVGGAGFGQLQRGFMVWEQPIQGYSSTAQMSFLYNPSSVTADYYMADSSVGSSLMFPTGFNATNLRVPLNQSVEWSLLFDRTFELWGSYDSNGEPLNQNPGDGYNPSVVGVLADIYQMEQFTGMFVGYSSGNSTTTAPTSNALTGHQGIIQLIPSYVYFGGNSANNSLWYYGYVSEWDVTVTHWTQYMVPMRCVINVTFTMLPPATNGSGSASNPGANTLPGQSGVGVSTSVSGTLPGVTPQSTIPTSGVSGR